MRRNCFSASSIPAATQRRTILPSRQRLTLRVTVAADRDHRLDGVDLKVRSRLEHARRNLLAEGLHPRRIMLSGSPMREVLDHYLPAIHKSTALGRLSLQRHGYFLVSAHREENVDSPARLRALLDCLRVVRSHWEKPVIVSTHPRTRMRLEALDAPMDLQGIHFSEPFGFLDYNHLQMKAFCVFVFYRTAERSARRHRF